VLPQAVSCTHARYHFRVSWDSMKHFLLLLAAAALACAAEPVRIIFDTDMGNDVDDALALAAFHAFESRGEARLLAVTVTKDNRFAAPFIDIVNTFYGRGSIPIGVVRNGKTTDDGKYTRVVVEKTPAYARKLGPDSEAPDAQAVLRRTLAAQPDGSVIIVQTGFSTNLARLLDSTPDDASPLTGRDLAKRKVKLLVLMAGAFFGWMPEYNVEIDIPSAQKVFAEWPTRLVTSGFEVGGTTLYPARRLETDFRRLPNPIVDAYRAYRPMPYDEPLWDPTAALYAVRPDDDYFSLSPEGRIKVDDKGRTTFEAGEGNRRYLIVNDVQRGRIIETIAALISEPAYAPR
jgi:inosine-uridine nucleoside N-ribohydrolase